MELSGWGGQAIYAVRLKARMDRPDDLEDPRQLHPPQPAEGGNGYGVAVKHGASALIERNVFDFNRHAITADGR